MRLDMASWLEVAEYLETRRGIFLPVGSTEQHGPMGLIGTDALCATAIAEGAAARAGAYVAPTLAYTPAPFNTGFPGTVSVTPALFEDLVAQVVDGLWAQGFARVYILNGHGANLDPVRRVLAVRPQDGARLRSWWDFAPVNALRQAYFGTWEGMHATPSEVAITQALYREIPPGAAATPPEPLSADYITAHAGDRHGPPDAHRAQFPDGRVGSHSALATPARGQALLDAAVSAVAEDFAAFCAS